MSFAALCGLIATLALYRRSAGGVQRLAPSVGGRLNPGLWFGQPVPGFPGERAAWLRRLRLGFLDSGPFRFGIRKFQGLEMLGFPWILSYES